MLDTWFQTCQREHVQGKRRLPGAVSLREGLPRGIMYGEYPLARTSRRGDTVRPTKMQTMCFDMMDRSSSEEQES